MRFKMCWAALAAALLTFSPSLAPTPSGYAQSVTEIFPLSQVHAGIHAVGKTILAGDQIIEFQVEVLGILHGVLAPKNDAILVKLSGGGIERTNVVAGMSGSPVYVDGKLMGAVAVSFPFAKEPYGLITPVESMLAVVPSGSGSEPATTTADENRPASNQFARVAGGSPGDLRWVPEDTPPWLARTAEPANASAPGMADLAGSMRLPLRFSGISSGLMAQFADAFRAIGLEPLAGGGLTGSAFEATAGSGAQYAPRPVDLSTVAQPGQMVSLQFVRGDFNLGADCTVTLRQGNRLYACGHPVFQTGSTDIPFAPARVLATVPALTVSFKIDESGTPIGSIHQDRFGAIYGMVGDVARTIPMTIDVESTLQRTETYHVDIAQAPLISPLLSQVVMASTLGASERALGPTTLEITGGIKLSTGDTVDIEDVLASDSGAANAVGVLVALPLNAVLSSGFPGLHVDSIHVRVKVRDVNNTATLGEAWASKTSVHPGDTIDVTTVVRTPGGESVTARIPVHIPDNVSSRMLQLVVGSGTAINAIEGRLGPQTSQPRDVHQLVKAINETRRNNRLYAVLMAPESSFRLGGDEFPSPPPSLVQTFMAEPASVGHVTMSATSMLADFSTAAGPYPIAGQQVLMLRVLRADE